MQGILTGSHKATFKHICFLDKKKTEKRQDHFHLISVANPQIPRNEDNIYSYRKMHLTNEAI